MSKYEFTLVIEGDLTSEAVARSLFDAGCDDATFGVLGGIGYAEFVREAPSASAAVLSAIREVESVKPLSVSTVQLGEDDLTELGGGETGHLLRSPKNARRLLESIEQACAGEVEETVVASAFFDELLAALDEPATSVVALEEAGERARNVVTPR